MAVQLRRRAGKRRACHSYLLGRRSPADLTRSFLRLVSFAAGHAGRRSQPGVQILHHLGRVQLRFCSRRLSLLLRDLRSNARGHGSGEPSSHALLQGHQLSTVRLQMFANNPGWVVKKEYRKRGTAAPEDEDHISELGDTPQLKAEEKHDETARQLE